MKNFLGKINLPYRNYILGSIFINIVLISGILLIRNKILPPEVPLFYGLPQGQEQLASSNFLIFPSIISIVITIINISLALVVRDNFLKKALIVAGIFSVLFPLATTLKIIFLVGSF